MKIDPLTVLEVREIAAFIEQVTPGPWEEGVEYRDCGVNDGSDPNWEAPPDIQEDQCTACASGDPLVRTYTDDRGYTRHIHRWDQRRDKRKQWDDLSPEDQSEFGSRERFEEFEEEFVSGDYAPWHRITSADTEKAVVGGYAIEMGGVATNQIDAEFIARCRKWVPRLLHTLEMLYANSGDPIQFPEEEIPQIREQLEQHHQVVTTRVLKEFGKYVEGQRVEAPWGDWLFIAKIERYANLKDHPFYAELTEEQKTEIGDNPLDVLYLRKLWGPAVIHEYTTPNREKLVDTWQALVGKNQDATILRRDPKGVKGGGREG